MIHILTERATPQQLADMLEALDTYVKLAVDVKRGILAGGGRLHADCEAVLLDDGSCQEDVWGADWVPATSEVHYESLINIRPGQGNPSMVVGDPGIRRRVQEITELLLKGV